jgi:UDPglucose 6-dehydrogenase
MTTKIAIIGLGFVGNAIHKSLDGWMSDDTVTVIDPAKGYNTRYEDIADYDAVFISVPSPQSADGTADTSILEAVLKDLAAVDFNGVIISKVTAPPQVYQRLQERYPNLVHAPEFLTAANAERDYINGRFAIIGGSVTAYRNEAERIIKMSQSSLGHVLHCSIQEAALAKYSINSFLATKVVFMNELALLANKLDCDWETVRKAVNMDHRIGTSHMQVPGPDGEFGFGGMCFPKDTAALIKSAEQVDAKLSVLDTAVKTNLILRLTDPK